MEQSLANLFFAEIGKVTELQNVRIFTYWKNQFCGIWLKTGIEFLCRNYCEKIEFNKCNYQKRNFLLRKNELGNRNSLLPTKN